MKYAALFLALSAAALLTGCGSTGTADSNDPSVAPVDANGQPVSSIPWNKPTSWEQGGALGSAMGH
jgi:hypothetical protein